MFSLLRRWRLWWAAMLALLLGGMVGGCTPRAASQADEGSTHDDHGDDHDHLHDHDHAVVEHRPHDFGAAVVRIGQLQASVLEELDEGHAEHAREAIDVMLDIARWLPEIAADSDMPEEQWHVVSADAKSLGQIYTALDDAVHQGATTLDRAPLGEVSEIIVRLQRIAADGAWQGDLRLGDDEKMAEKHD